VRTKGRSARVVSEVLLAAAEEIGAKGYAALRVEDVAARSGVNKTTIYRRWPTKVDLVAATILHFADVPEPPETGSVRTDLLALLKHTAARAGSRHGRGIVRMIQLERSDPEVDLVAQRIAKEQMRPRRIVLERAMARGELPQGTDVDLILELVFSPVVKRIAFARESPTESFLERVVDIVLAGARSGAGARPASGRRPRPAASK
jgi:AcrR family transcriptional regulator